MSRAPRSRRSAANAGMLVHLCAAALPRLISRDRGARSTARRRGWQHRRQARRAPAGRGRGTRRMCRGLRRSDGRRPSPQADRRGAADVERGQRERLTTPGVGPPPGLRDRDVDCQGTHFGRGIAAHSWMVPRERHSFAARGRHGPPADASFRMWPKGNGLILLPRPRLSKKGWRAQGAQRRRRGWATYCFILALRRIFWRMCV